MYLCKNLSVEGEKTRKLVYCPFKLHLCLTVFSSQGVPFYSAPNKPVANTCSMCKYNVQLNCA